MKRILYFALVLATMCSLSACSVLKDNMSALGIIGGADGPTEIIVTDVVDSAASEEEETPVVEPTIHPAVAVDHAPSEVPTAWSALGISTTESTVGMAWVSYHASGTLTAAQLDGHSLLSTWFGQAYSDVVYQSVADELPLLGSLNSTSDIYYVVPQTYGTCMLVQTDALEYQAVQQPFFLVAGENIKLFTVDADGNPDLDITPTTNALGTTVLASGVENLSAYIAVDTHYEIAPEEYIPASVYAFAGENEDLANVFLQSALDQAITQVTTLYPTETPPSVMLSTDYFTFSARTMGFEVEAYFPEKVDTYRIYAQLPAENTDFIGMSADNFQTPFTLTKVAKVLEFVPSYEDIALAKVYATDIGGDAAVQFWNGIRYLATTQGQTTLTPLQVKDYSILLTASYVIPALPEAEVVDADGTVLLPLIPLDSAGCYQIPMALQLETLPQVLDFDFPAGLVSLSVPLADVTYTAQLSRQMDSINSWTVTAVTKDATAAEADTSVPAPTAQTTDTPTETPAE